MRCPSAVRRSDCSSAQVGNGVDNGHKAINLSLSSRKYNVENFSVATMRSMHTHGSARLGKPSEGIFCPPVSTFDNDCAEAGRPGVLRLLYYTNPAL